MWNKNIVLTDLETSGLNPALQEIIEIGAIKISQPDLKVLGWLNLKVHMDHPEFGQQAAFQVNGYTPDAWQDTLLQKEAMEQYGDFSKGCVFAAYNVAFDHGFVDSTFLRLGMKNPMSYHRLDVLSLVWGHFTDAGYKNIRLKDACGYLGVKPEPAVHRAALGALTALRVLRALRCKDNKEALAISEAELDVLEKEIMVPPTPRPDDAEEMSRQTGQQHRRRQKKF